MAKNYSLRGFAEKLGYTAAYLCDIEMSRRNPPNREVMEKICELLDADVNELMELARRDRKKIELNVDTKTEPIRDMAFNLARAFEDMDEKTALAISRLLKKSKGD